MDVRVSQVSRALATSAAIFFQNMEQIAEYDQAVAKAAARVQRKHKLHPARSKTSIRMKVRGDIVPNTRWIRLDRKELLS